MNRTSVCIAVSLFALLALSACVPSATIIHTVPSAELEERDEDEETAAKSQNTLLAEDAAENAKTTFRQWYLPMYRSRKVGFRCVQDVPEK